MEYGRITPKQREILEYIKQEILNRGYPPTVRVMRCSTFKVYIFYPLSSGIPGEKRLYPQRPVQAACDRDRG